MASTPARAWRRASVTSACVLFAAVAAPTSTAAAGLRAGASAVDITPQRFPVLVNGNFLPVVADKASDRLHARWLVLDDGRERIGLCVVDSCLMPRELLDEAKALIRDRTGLPPDHVLISATHTHSAPSVMGCLGTDADPNYPRFLVQKLVEGAAAAVKNLEPAKAGWGSAQLPEYTHCRQWVYRPDRMLRDPFGDLTVRANMHPGYENAAVIGPTGPVDAQLSLLSVQGATGRPIAVLANYSMHYFGSPAVSSDYYGLFCEKLSKKVVTGREGEAPVEPYFVAIMSQGTSGDQHWMDYSKPEKKLTIDQYAEALASAAYDVYRGVQHRADLPVSMREKELRLNVRAPDEKRLAWAREVVSKLKDDKPTSQPEIYAREQVFLHDKPTHDLKLQAIRIGDLAIAAMPCEVFGITGLKIKAQSPFPATFNIELANGEDGYIPPPELHPLGGYTTWPARTACLEPGAEPKIVQAVLGLLEEASGQKRRPVPEPRSAYADAVRALKPMGYWPLNGFSRDDNGASFEDGVVFYLEGPQSKALSADAPVNRAAHFAGGRMRCELPKLGKAYTVSMWFWNGLDPDARPTAGCLFSRGIDGRTGRNSDHLCISGTGTYQGAPKGVLTFFNERESAQVEEGTTPIRTRQWNHVVFVRDGKRAVVYLNGRKQPEIDAVAGEKGEPPDATALFFGGRSDNYSNFEGRIDEVAVYDRALNAEEAARLFAAADVPAPPAKESPIKPDPPKSPEESLKSIRVKDGFEVQLVAAEPLTIDPVAIAWGPDGKLWVVEMADYPYGVRGDFKPPGGSRIRYLEDTDGDGAYDKSTLFMEGVNFPNGILPWRKGVLVTAAPEIFYAEDTDGDGRADKKEVLYGPFTEGNPQLRVNGLRWGLDNWVYCANGWSSRGKVKSSKTGAEVDVGGRDIRIRPDTGEIEADTGMSEFGRNRDDWNDWFGCDNAHPMWHFVLPDRYTKRNPHVPPPEPREQLIRPFPPRVYAIHKPEHRYAGMELADFFQSACAAMVYRDDLLFPRVDDGKGNRTQHAFVCDPVHSIIHHEVLTDRGVTFDIARPPDEQTTEFFASTDNWTRPTMALTGPDGALWVVDMYRFMIEHPEYLPPIGKEELKPFYRLGEDKGRIYRIVPKGKALRKVPRMDRWRTIELARAAMDNSNGWQRDMAQMLLIWNRDRMMPEAAGELQGVVYGSRNPLARLQALCTLDGLDALKPEVLVAALADRHPAVRRQAIRLSEAKAKDSPELIAAAAKLADDPDPKVRLQLALSLGEWDEPAAAEALARVAVRDGDDPYIAAAVMSSAKKHYGVVARAVIDSKRPPQGRLYVDLLRMCLALNDRETMTALLEPLLDGDNVNAGRMQTLAAFLDAAGARGTPVDKLPLAGAEKLFDAAARTAPDPRAPAQDRVAAVALLGRRPQRADEDLKTLTGLLVPRESADLQRAAVAAIGRVGGDRVPQVLLAGWAGHSPEVRGAIVDLFLRNEKWTDTLLDAVEAKHVTRADFDVPRRQTLLNHGIPRLRARAQSLLGQAVATNRQKVLDANQPVLSMTGDAKRGAVPFKQHCAVCHRLGDQGQDVGPNLATVRDWTKEALLTSILDPSRQAEPRYLAYNATTGSETVYGVIAAETGNSIRMVGLDGKEKSILRDELKALTSTGRSLMPDGFESAMSKQELSDLMQFLKTPVQ